MLSAARLARALPSVAGKRPRRHTQMPPITSSRRGEGGKNTHFHHTDSLVAAGSIQAPTDSGPERIAWPAGAGRTSSPCLREMRCRRRRTSPSLSSTAAAAPPLKRGRCCSRTAAAASPPFGWASWCMLLLCRVAATCGSVRPEGGVARPGSDCPGLGAAAAHRTARGSRQQMQFTGLLSDFLERGDALCEAIIADGVIVSSRVAGCRRCSQLFAVEFILTD